MSVTFKLNYTQVDRNSSEYLSQLLNDKKQLQIFPNVFIHLEKILDEEINRVRQTLLQLNSGNNNELPEPVGAVVSLSEKLMVPVNDYPDYNFVGRILGPRGMTVKQLEIDTGCKVMVRGKGSMRDKQKEEVNRTKPNWEHLNEDLHVLITCEDAENRARIKINRAKEEVKKLLVPTPDGEDDLKRRQLVELALLNGTYRDTSTNSVVGTPVSFTPTSVVSALPMSQTPHVLASSQLPTLPAVLAAPSIQGGTQLILAPRLTHSFNSVSSLPTAAGTPTLLGAAAPSSILPGGEAATAGSLLYQYNPYMSPLVDYSAAAAASLERSSAGAIRRSVAYREHPYAR